LNALITGASSGIGFELSKVLCRDFGYRVLGVGRNTVALKKLSEELGGCFSYLAADLSRIEEVNSVADYVVREFDRLDLLVNNAGFGVYGGVLQHSDEDLISVTTVNFLSPLILTKRLVGKMGRGSTVVFVVTAGIHVLMRDLPIYGAAKIALHYSLEALREELKGVGINVLAVYPGLVRTEFHRRAGREVAGGADPADVAKKIAQAIRGGKKRLYVPRYLTVVRLLGPYLPAFR